VKEQFWVKGQRSTINTKRLKDWEAPEDAEFVARIKKAGGILLGKTNAAKDLLDFQTNGDIYGECKNPFNEDFTPGGSSGGAAAALASGMTPLEMGGDLGGSIRVPANFCGVYGLKPTEHTIPGHGNVPKPKREKGFIFDMAVGGPMARTPEDVELLWTIVSGPDKRDRRIQPVHWEPVSDKKINDYKIAWVDRWAGFDTSLETKRVIKNYVSLLKGQGVQVDQAEFPGDLHERTLEIYKKLAIQMISQELPWFIKPLLIASMKRGFLRGMKKVPWKIRDSFLDYSANIRERADLIREWENHFESYDFLICPSGFGRAFRRCKMGSEIEYENNTIQYINYVLPYNAIFNASGHPAMNIPLGLGKEGLPRGIQLVGSYWSDPDLIHFAKLTQKISGGFIPPEGYY
jgi:amidase